MTAFVPALQLSREAYAELVRPALDSSMPALPHAAALLGRGSEVLGLDDETSTDHDWSARVLVFVGDEVREEVEDLLRDLPVATEVHTVRGYLLEALGLDLAAPIRAVDWLTASEQGLGTISAGEVFHDSVGLGEARDRLAYYPRDVWLYLMVAGWWRLGPEANLVGRAGDRGDELGSALIGSALVEDAMRLCFLMERRFAPYSKWFGTAFSRLGCAGRMAPLLERVLAASTWQLREEALVAVTAELVRLHDGLGLTAPAGFSVERMWGRPYRAGWSDCAELLRAEIRDPEVVAIADRWPVGPVDRFRHLLWAPRNRAALAEVLAVSEQ